MEPALMALPVVPDSLDSGNKFDRSSLLRARKAADWFHPLDSSSCSVIATDSLGFLNLDKPVAAENSATFHLLSSRIRPSRFVKGKLKAESNAMFEVFVDGVSKIKKTTVDSVAKEATSAISLAPEYTSEIEVHILDFPKDGKPSFSLRFIPDSDFENVDLAVGPDVERRFSIETTTLGVRLNRTAISPDGRYILLNFTETFGEADNRSWSELRLASNNAVVSTSLPSDAAWMPTGSTLFYSERSADLFAIFKMDATRLAPILVCDNSPVSAAQISWAPDGNWFVYSDFVKGKKEEGVMRRVTEPDDRLPGNRNRSYLYRYELSSGISYPLTYGGPSTSLADISSDSRRILYTATRQTPGQFPFYNVSVIELDVNTLKTDTIVANSGGIAGAIYSPDNKQILLWGGPNEFDGIGRNAGNHEWANDFDVQAYLLDLKSRKVKSLTRDFDPSVSGTPIWNKVDGLIYFIAVEGFYQKLCTLNPKTGSIKTLPAKVDFVRNFSIGNDESKYIAYCGMGYTYLGQGWIMDLKSGRNTLLADPMKEEFAALTLGNSQSWTFKSSNGDIIDGTLTLPPNFDPSRKYPLIVYYYGGTTPSNRTSHSPYTPQLFASRDYVVYVVNPSGTIGYGQEFSARHVNAWGERTAEDIIEGVKKLCEEKDFIDSHKIGCLGASYGGFMTQLLQTKTDLFAAAVSHAGISNVTSYWGEGYWGYSYNSVAAANSYPWTNPDLFTKHGSLFNADKIHTPLLLLHGSRDTNVPIGESIQLFNALKILNRDVEFITVEDQDHVITNYDKRKLWHATIMAWFAKYLQNDPRWWDSMYGK
ncbi:MAG: S9 family peptidase [Muribaculaceae bacterium]|nr:S9 family peptidase [Muribaculaceae bacterium]